MNEIERLYEAYAQNQNEREAEPKIPEYMTDEWIREVLAACATAPWHNYLFLTKNPERYPKAVETYGSFENVWLGTSITEPEDMARITQLPEGLHRFVCFEPLLGRMDAKRLPSLLGPVDWVIIGAETGHRKMKTLPDRKWIEEIVRACRRNNIPVHIKASSEMTTVWGKDLIQERPKQLKHEEVIIPHCEGCEYHEASERHYNSVKDVMLMNHTCSKLGQRIGGRYARTSPAWCPLRGLILKR